MAIKSILLLGAAAPVVRAFGVAPSPLPDPDGPIRIDTQTESVCSTGESAPAQHCKYTLSIIGTTDLPGPGGVGVPFCPCTYAPIKLPNNDQKKIKKCKKAAKWLAQNKISGLPKTPDPLQTNDFEYSAYSVLKGCRYRQSTNKVYYNPNNDATGVEGLPVPLGDYSIVCKSIGDKNEDGIISGADYPDPLNNPCLPPAAVTEFGTCTQTTSLNKGVPPGGCASYNDRKGDCSRLRNEKGENQCVWKDTPTKNTR